MDSPSFRVSATLGQLAAGPLVGQSLAALTGFWLLQNNIATGIWDSPEVPPAFFLGQNHPNPFNPTTTIPFAVPRESHVRLRVFDVRGQLVAELVNEVRSAGVYREVLASPLASGTYFYRLEANGFVQTRKSVLLK